MSTVPRMTERSPRLVELVFHSKPGVTQFQVGAANTLDVAYAGTTPMFTFSATGTYRSPGVRKRRLGHTQYSNRGLARAHYDPEDFWVAGGTLPHDADLAYIRVAEVNPAGVVGAEGPVYLLPPPGLYTNPRPALSTSGTAPSVTIPTTNLPPPEAMHLVVPRFVDNVRIQNLSGTDPLLVAFGVGQPLVSIPLETSETFYDGAFSDLILCGDGVAVPFDIRFSLVNSEMA